MLFGFAQICLMLAKIAIVTGADRLLCEMKNEFGRIFTLDEVASYLKVGKRTVYRLAGAKKIPAFKVGGTWRFSRADIDNWIKQQSMDGLVTGREEDDATKGKSNNGGRK